MTPRRIQRKRTRGWRMPPGCVYCGRPSKWGNPFDWRYWRDYGDTVTEANAFVTQQFRDCLLGYDEPIDPDKAERMAWIREHVGELRGHDLCCWCRLNEPCHVDALLEAANA